MICKNCGHQIVKNYFTKKWGHWEPKMQEIEKECSYKIRHEVFCKCTKPEPKRGVKDD